MFEVVMRNGKNLGLDEDFQEDGILVKVDSTKETESTEGISYEKRKNLWTANLSANLTFLWMFIQ